MSEKTSTTVEERKARILIKLRGYRLLGRKVMKTFPTFRVKTATGERLTIFCFPTKGTVGVAYINQVKKAMKEAELNRAIVIASGRYTRAAKVQSAKANIELIPRIFPSFNIYDHVLVPKHEIATAEEREELLSKYRVKPYQLPKLKASDPAVTAIGAKPGDVVKILRDSLTAGKYVSYRYVIDG